MWVEEWVEVGDAVFWTRGTTCTNCGERKQRYWGGTRQASVADLQRGRVVGRWEWDGESVCS